MTTAGASVRLERRSSWTVAGVVALRTSGVPALLQHDGRESTGPFAAAAAMSEQRGQSALPRIVTPAVPRASAIMRAHAHAGATVPGSVSSVTPSTSQTNDVRNHERIADSIPDPVETMG